MSVVQTQFSIVCLSPQPWRTDLPTNRQQIMLRAAERGHRVLFVETGWFIGRHLRELLRRPRLSLLRELLSAQEVVPGVYVRKGIDVLPRGHTYRLANRVNNAATAAVVRRLVRRRPGPTILWIYDPCASGMVGSCAETFAVYDCVDDYAEQAGPSARRRTLVAELDRRTARVARIVFATTKSLYVRHHELNSATHLVPNVGDFRHFARAADREFIADELRSTPRPVIGFAGNFLATKVDFDLLERIAERREWTLLLVGPSRPDTEAALARVTSHPNVHWVGAKPYADLPRYVAAFDVGLIPYLANAYTQSCFPLKLYEYLAAGKPVVASGVPDVGGREPDVVLAPDHSTFLAAIESALADERAENAQRRMALAAENTWETRTERLLGLIATELERCGA